MRLVQFFCHEVVCKDFVIGAMAAILQAKSLEMKNQYAEENLAEG